MIYSVEIQITTPVHDTEITDRVEDAVQNLFPNVTFEQHPGEIIGETHSLEEFAVLLHEQEILDTARREFFKHANDESFRFSIKKQAAFKGMIILFLQLKTDSHSPLMLSKLTLSKAHCGGGNSRYAS